MSTMTSVQLLRKAVAALEEGSHPFQLSFLNENGVTLDQVSQLVQHLALGGRMVARAIEDPRSPQGTAMLMTLAEEARD